MKDWINSMKTLFTITFGWRHPSGGAGRLTGFFEFIRSGSKQPKAGQATGAPRLGLYPFYIFTANITGLNGLWLNINKILN